VNREVRVTQPDFRRTREKLVVGNWKMSPAALPEALALARAAAAIDGPGVTVGVAPPAPWLVPVADALRGSNVLLFGQDAHWEEMGAFTGQVSAPMLVGIANGTIVGHSEVRRDQGDDDARVARKAAAALRSGLRVVYCLGESLDERQGGRTADVISRQVRDGLGAIDRDLFFTADGAWRLAIAYEPIWAIGTGVPASGAQAGEAIGIVRTRLDELGLAGAAASVLYGGSVSAASVAEFARADGVDGALVGGASLKADEFAAIVHAFR
jgi:triosephosphate isomerase